MKKIVLLAFSLFFIGSSSHATEQNVSFSPEFAEIKKIYDEMTPEQRAEVMAQAKRIQAQLAEMPIAERQRLYSDAAEAVKTIDFSKVDVSRIDTKKQVSLSQIDEMMDNRKKASVRVDAKAKNPSKPIVD